MATTPDCVTDFVQATKILCRVESEKWLGIKIGPHRHRHNLATMMADEAPEAPGAAATVLGISEGRPKRSG
jgi:hypothetical protein